MPTTLLRPCAQPSCSALVSAGRCQLHSRQVEQARGSSQSRGYTARWARFRFWYLQRLNALCADGIGLGAICGGRFPDAPVTTHSQCLIDGRVTASALQVDHIVPVRRGGPMYQTSNLQVLCASCHSAKTDADDGGFGR